MDTTNDQEAIEEILLEEREFTPGMDFRDGTVFVAVPRIVIEPDKKGNLQHVKLVEIITSENDSFILSSREMIIRGLWSDRYPAVDPRWSEGSKKAFVNGTITMTPNISMEEIFRKIHEVYRYYIDFLDKRVYSFMSVWVIGTYFHRLFYTYPYIHLNGHPQSGKSQTLELTGSLAFNGELTFHCTPAYTIRAISSNHATCCVDEAERLNSAKDEESQAVRAMLNAGYKRGSFAGKAEPGAKKGKWEIRKFEAYSPKMFASIKDLNAVLKTRVIPITMVESADQEIKNRQPNLEDEIFQQIRDELYWIMMTEHGRIKEIYDNLSDGEILGREWELWRPILSVATLIDKENLYPILRKFAIDNGAIKRRQREEETASPKILEAFLALLGREKEGFYSTAELADCLCEYDDEFFGWMKRSDEEKIKGKAGRFIRGEINKLAIGRSTKRYIEGCQKRGYLLDKKAIQDRLKGIGNDTSHIGETSQTS
jgi:hypothetical protein